mgnify:FL=1
MIRRTKFWKRLICGLLLALTMTSVTSTVVKAQVNNPRYELSETMVTRKEVRGKILLDLPHQDTAQDNGASYGGVTERELAESISLKVKNILEQNGVEVVLVREQGQSMSLGDRIYKANNMGEYDYFISLHINSCASENTGTGVEGYSCGAWTLSNKILKGLSNEFGYLNRGLYYSPYYNSQIKQNNTLIELGFINNEYDRGNLMNRQDDYARIISDAILDSL